MVDIHYGNEGTNMNKWQLKIDLEPESIGYIEKILGYKLPDSFKNFLSISNASNPQKDRFHIDSDVYVLNNVLNFNQKSTENFYDAYTNLNDTINNLIPFAKDSFGNYILFNPVTMEVYLYDHETGKKALVSIFDDFIDSLF